jgi:hypothetical protein
MSQHSFSQWSPRFAARAVDVGFVVDKVALGHVFSLSLPVLSGHYHSTVAAYSHIVWGMDNGLISGHYSTET